MKNSWLALLGALVVGGAIGFISGKNTAPAPTASSPEESATRTRSGSRDLEAAAQSHKKSARKTDPTAISRLAGSSNRVQALLDFYGGLSPEQLAEEAAKLENLPINERLIASFLLFGRWAEVDASAAMAFSNTMGMAGGFVRPTILQSWASVDPVTAAQYYLQNPREFAAMDMMAGGRGPMGGQGASAIIASEWARQDPAAAMAWASSLANGKGAAMISVISEVAKTDPGKASEMIEKMDVADRAGAYRDVALKYGALDFSNSQSWIQTLPAAEQAGAMASAIQGLASKDPQAAFREINKMANGASKDQAITTAIKELGRNDPQAAAALVTSQTSPLAQRNALREFMPAFTSQNPTAARAYIDTFGPGPVRDRAAQEYVFANTTQPARELMTLADSITDEGDRSRAVGITAMRWMREDAPAAKTYIQGSTSLPDDAKQRLMNGGGFWSPGGGGGRRN